MLEVLYYLGGPLITAILAPIVVGMFTKAMNKRKEERTHDFSQEQHDDKIAKDLRDEMRADIKQKNERIKELEDSAVSSYEAITDRDKWKAKYFSIKKEKDRISFELTLLQKELETIRRQYEHYAELRARAEKHVNGDS